MKTLINAENLKAEIERRRLSNRYIDTEGYEAELFEIINSLQQEQPEGIKGNSEEIPSNVDSEKAAKEYAKINDKSSITKGFSIIKFAAFKAGAEWQRKQPEKLTWEDAQRLCLIWREVSNELDACSENFPKWSSSTKDMFNEVLRRFYENDSSGI